MHWLEHLIPPPLVALLVGLAMWGLSRFSAPFVATFEPRLAAFVVLLALGFASSVSGFLTFRRAGANPDPHRIDRGEVLVTGGVYRWTRNPMYLGLALALCGYAIYLSRPVAILGPIAFIAFITRFQIIPEERAMSAKFGDSYARYRNGTRRWL